VVEVTGYNANSDTGSYAIRAYKDSDGAKTNLLRSPTSTEAASWSWTEGTIASHQTIIYHLTNTKNSQTYLQWDDAKDGSGLYDADITVSVTGSGGAVKDWQHSYVTDRDSAYTNPVLFESAASDDDVTVTVTCVKPGSFRIRGWTVGNPKNTLRGP
jgi:hypothetical protein